MCLGVVPSRAGAYLPRVRAPPAPAKLWHIAQLTRKIWPPSAIALLFSAVPGWMTVVSLSSGTAGPGSTEAAPTPTSEGPDLVPCAATPWQVAQLAMKRSLPWATASAAAVGAAALASLGARNE